MSSFDTHAAVTALRNAGIEERQAEAIAKTIRDATDINGEGLATQEDLTRLATKADVYQVALGIGIVNTMITFALLKLVP